MAFVKEDQVVRSEQQAEFLTYPAARKLAQLAKAPFDLRHITPERLRQYVSEACGFKLLYGTERVNDQILTALEELAQETHALEKMQKMQAGEEVNAIENYPSENRPALHTATRDLFNDSNPAPKAKEAANLARQELEKLRSFLAKIETEKKYSELILIGIGGSDLGPRAHYYALEYLLKPGRKVHFISNIDPDDAAQVLRQANLQKSLVVVISKSGTTQETLTNEELVREKFKEAEIDPHERFISITMPGTPLDNKENYLETFYMWDWIGGRYCTTSVCGGLLLGFAFGIEVFMEFLSGAHAMDQAALSSDIKHNLPLLSALIGIWNRTFLHYPTLAIIAYAQPLVHYAAHLQQLDMESNGKMIDKKGRFVDFQTGPIIWGEPGTNSQHSFFQLIHQGTSTVPILMIGFKESSYGEDIAFEGTTSHQKLLANLFAQALGLAQGQKADNPNKFFPGNRPTSILLAKKLTPFSVGALLAFYEHRVAFQGFIWGINSFDQEGVQLGKVLAKKIMQRFAVQSGKTSEQEAYPLGDALIEQLDSL